MHNNPKGQMTYSEHFGFTSFSGMCTVNEMPKGMIDYLRRNPSGFSTLKNMDKYFEQKESSRYEDQTVFWWFPPMRKRTNSEIRREKERIRATSRNDEENLNDSEINENFKLEIEAELEEDYIDFPDPLEYLIGFFATKSDSAYKYQTNAYPENSVKAATSSKKSYAVQENLFNEAEPKQLYKSYYEYKKPSNDDQITFDVSNTINHSSRPKYSNNASLQSSYEKPNIFAKNKNSADYQKLLSKTMDNDERLWRTLGEEEMFESRQNSIGRSSIEPYDQFSEQKSL